MNLFKCSMVPVNTLLPGTMKQKLDTPALILDLEIMDRNIETAAAFFRGVDATLRPHSKTNKCPPIARAQIEAGATGICCAKVGEAEVMVEGGIKDRDTSKPRDTTINIHSHYFGVRSNRLEVVWEISGRGKFT